MADRILSEVLEIDLDRCQHVYGSAPCTASGGSGSECYNTFATCQDKPNYSATTHTIKFTKRGAPIERGELVRPYITDISRAPTEINIEEGYAQRSVTTVRVADEPDSDVDEDPYFATRATPAQGTFWTRLLARSPNYQYRPARLVRAFVDAGVWGSTRTEKYIVDEIRGPNNSGSVTVTLKDPLKKVDRIKIPAPTDGKLLADFLATSHTGTAQGGTVTTITLANDAEAVDDFYNGQEVYITGGDGTGQRRVITDYTGATRVATVSGFAVVPTAQSVYEVAPLELDVGTAYISQYRDPGVTGDREFVAVGDEIIEYTGISSGKLQWSDGSYRGAFGTVREDHNADDVVQQCWVKFGETFTQVVQDILTDSGIASGDIDTTGFAAEEGEWLGALYNITCCITEPTDGDDLVEELLPLAQSVIWWDPVDQKVKFQVLLPDYAGSTQSWSDASEFISESVRVEQLSDLRLTRAAMVFGLRKYTAADDEATNYSNSEIVVDTDAESANEYGDVRPEIVYSRWFQQSNRVAAHAWAARKVVQYRDVPKRLEAEFDPKDAPIALGSQATVTTRYLTDVTGAAKPTRVVVTRVSDVGGRIRVRMRALATDKQNGDAKRYAYIAPNGTADHPTETTYAHIADTSTVLMGDGSDPYLII